MLYQLSYRQFPHRAGLEPATSRLAITEILELALLSDLKAST